MGNTENILLSLCFIIVSTEGSMSSHSYGQFGVASEEESNSTRWPTKMTFHETKTNYMLGSAILRRLYGRMDHTENLIKTEINHVYEKLRDQIQKNFRKCDRQRRRVEGSSKTQNGTNNHKSGTNNNGDNKQFNRKVNVKDQQEKKGGRRDRKGKNERKPTIEGYSQENDNY